MCSRVQASVALVMYISTGRGELQGVTPVLEEASESGKILLQPSLLVSWGLWGRDIEGDYGIQPALSLEVPKSLCPGFQLPAGKPSAR